MSYEFGTRIYCPRGYFCTACMRSVLLRFLRVIFEKYGSLISHNYNCISLYFTWCEGAWKLSWVTY